MIERKTMWDDSLNTRNSSNDDEFVKICSYSELKENTGKRFLINDVDVAVYKVKGKVYALSNVCPHQKAAKMYEGFIENDKVVCPLHGWEFNLCNGQMHDGRKGLDSYEVKVDDGDVYVKVFKRELKW